MKKIGTRSLIKGGNRKTWHITVPKSWINDQDISHIEKPEVELFEDEDGRLVISVLRVSPRKPGV